MGQGQTLENPQRMSGLPVFRASHGCYNEFSLDGYRGKHNLCVVIKSSAEGKVEFIDVADRYNPLSTGLKTCIENKLKTQDFSEHAGATLLWQIKLEANR